MRSGDSDSRDRDALKSASLGAGRWMANGENARVRRQWAEHALALHDAGGAFGSTSIQIGGRVVKFTVEVVDEQPR